MHRGILYAASAYTLWGLFPLYLRLMNRVEASEILAHRMVWSLVFVSAVLLVLRRGAWIREVLRSPATLARFAGSALLVSVNWGLFIWAINNGHVVDSSLGYFINPLVNVLAGYFLLQERLRPLQWMAAGLAALGVLWLTWVGGQLPWIGLTLAVTFSGYGLMRKTARLGAIEGLALETALLAPFATGFLIWLAHHGQSAFVQADAGLRALLLLAGPATAIPLLLFAAGARRIPFSLLGILQYIGPSLQLLLGIWVFGESFPFARALGFAAIWAALALYTAESIWRMRRGSHA